MAWLFCLAIGPFLVVDGLAGLVFAGTGLSVGDHLPHRAWNWFFEFNDWHQILHVVSGGILVLGVLRRTWLAPATLIFGAIYLVAAPLGFWDGDDVANIVYSDVRDNIIHALLTIVATGLGLGTALASPRPKPHGDRAFRS